MLSSNVDCTDTNTNTNTNTNANTNTNTNTSINTNGNDDDDDDDDNDSGIYQTWWQMNYLQANYLEPCISIKCVFLPRLVRATFVSPPHEMYEHMF